MTRVLKGVSPVPGSTKLPAHAVEAWPTSPIASGESRPVRQPLTQSAATSPAPTTLPAAELDALRSRASREGYEQGRRSAEQDAQEALARQQEEARKLLDRLEDAVTHQLADLEQLAVEVAFEACARVLGEALLDRGAIVAVVRSLLEQTGEPARLVVHLPPADLALVQGALQDDEHWRHRQLRFEADPSLKPGACRVTTPHGQLETSLDVQLGAVQERLVSAFAQRSAERGRE